VPKIASALTNRTAIGVYQTKDGTSQLLATGWKHWLTSNATELKLTVLIAAAVALAGLLN